MDRTLFADVKLFDRSGAAPFPGEVLVEGNRVTAVAAATQEVTGYPARRRARRDAMGRRPVSSYVGRASGRHGAVPPWPERCRTGGER